MEIVLENLPFLLKGAYYTLLITVVSMIFGSIIAVITAIARLKGNKLIRWIARAYAEGETAEPEVIGRKPEDAAAAAEGAATEEKK